jgi:hypothetical protein
MLVIDNDKIRDNVGKACTAALRMGALPELARALIYLDTYAKPDDSPYKSKTRCTLFPDSAPLSFTFRMDKRNNKTGEYNYWFNGGLIYSGPDCPADGSFPSLSVDVNPSDKPTWRVHM